MSAGAKSCAASCPSFWRLRPSTLQPSATAKICVPPCPIPPALQQQPLTSRKRTASTRITVIGIRKNGGRSCCFSPFPLVKDIFSNLLEVSQKADTCPLKPRFPKKSLNVRLTNCERLFIIRDSKETNVREALICRTEPSVPCINAQAKLGWGYFYDSVSL